MKNIFMSALCVIAMVGTTNASFMYEEIDPICSISGTTHTSFPGEISDTSTWNIPKAYDGECDDVFNLDGDDKKRVYSIMINYLEKKGYLEQVTGGYTATTTGRDFIQNQFFPAVQNYISNNRQNKKATAILNYAVKMIGYDYYVSGSDLVDYLGLTETQAQDLAEQNDVVFRIGMRDGEAYATTDDYVIGRITATIENGIVVDYSVEK